MSPRPAVSPFHNLSVAHLADAYGAVCAELRGIEVRRDALKAALLARAGKAEEVAGENFSISISRTVRWTVDAAAVRSEMGEAWVDARSKLANVTSLRATLIAVPAPLAA